MAPKLRPRKKLKTEAECPTGPSPSNCNFTGFAALPPELLLEIVNHLPLFPVPCNRLKSPMKEATDTRQEALIVLVQLCRSFRQALIHLLREEIILCSLHGGQRNTTTNPAWIRHTCGLDLSSYCAPCERYLASEIVSQLETVTVRVPDFATRVQTLSIFLPKYSAKTIVPEFARCLALLPNLTTLQFHYNSSGYALDDDLQRVFSQYQYPNIQTLVIPCNIRSLRVLKACPKVRHLHFTSIERDYSGMDVCPSVEKFTGEAPEAPQPSRPVPEFLRQLPNLKYLQMRLGASGPSSYYISPLYRAETLSPLRHLEVVEIAIMHTKARKEAEALLASVDSVLARMPTMSGIHRRVELTDYTTQLD